MELAHLILGGGRPDQAGWPGIDRLQYSYASGAVVHHPHDPGVWLGDIAGLSRLPADVDTVITLCRYGARQVPDGIEHVVFRLLDTTRADNPNLEFVLDDAAHTIAELRDRGRIVYLHCVAGQSRTPTVAARYAVLRGVPLETALADVCRAMPAARPNPALLSGLRALPAV